MSALSLKNIRCNSFKCVITRFALFSLILPVILSTPISIYAQPSPPSRPILFVHGFCGNAYDIEPLLNSIYPTLDQTLYPSPTLYLAQFNSIHNTIQFWILEGAGTPLQFPSPVDESAIPTNARFFSIILYDPVSLSTDPVNVQKISVLNKAYEVSQVIKHITSITHIQDVILLGHSMGGLDSRAYIENLASQGACYDYENNLPHYEPDTCKPGCNSTTCMPNSSYGLPAYANDVGDLITVDTPHLGSPLASLVVTAAGTGLACFADTSTNTYELEGSNDPLGYLTHALNYSGQSIAGQTPAENTVPIQAIEDYLSDLAGTAAWDLLPGESDDIVELQSQAIPSSVQTNSAESVALQTKDVPISYVNSDISGNQGCLVDGLQVMHLMSCLGTLPLTQSAIVDQINAHDGGTLTSINVNATHNGSAWTGAVNYQINGPDSFLVPEITVPVKVSDVSLGTYSVSNISGGPPSTGTPTITVSPTPTIQQGQWTTTFTIDFTDKIASTTAVSVSEAQISVGASLTISATVRASSGEPTGTVTFYDNGKTLGAGIVNNSGVASYSTVSLPLGTNSITATYGGDSNYSASATTSAVTVTVVAISPQLTVSPSNGVLGVTSFVKTDTGFTPYGLITHTATLPDKSLSVLQTNADGNGAYSYSRTYSTLTGPYSQIDTDVSTGQSTPPATWTVSPLVTNDFSLQMSPSTQTVNQGGSVTYTVITATTTGSSQSVVLTATNLPSGITASFNPSTVTSGSQSILTLSAISSAATGTYSLTLVGTGTSATNTMQFSATVAQVARSGAQLTSSPLNFTFNPQTVDTASAPFVFSLVNTGGTALTISSVTESPQFFASFLNGEGLPITLQPNGGYANMQVVFVPNATGQQTGTINLFNSTNASPLTLNVSGSGVVAPVTTGNIQVNATFNGSPWNGYLGYTLTGPLSFNGVTAPNTYYNLTPGSYTVAYSIEGPGGATFTGITPAASQSLTAGTTLTYTLNFSGSNTFAMLGSQPSSAVIAIGASTQFELGVCYTTGATQTVSLAASGLPPGATASFSTNPVTAGCSGTASTVTITTNTSTPPGVYPLLFTGTNEDGYSRSTSASLTVDIPPISPTIIDSLSISGTQGNEFSGALSVNQEMVSNTVSANGRYVAYISSATNLVPNDTSTGPDIFVRDTQLGTTTRVSVASDGTQGDNESLLPSISGDGRFVSFSSVADNFVAGAISGQQGIYLHDMSSGATTRVDLAPDGSVGNNSACCSSVSADGRFIAFQSSSSNLVPSVSGTNIFRLDTKTNQMLLASVASDGTTVGGGSYPQISADGRFVVFTSSATDLVPGETNGVANAFLHDFETGQTIEVNVASDGTQDNCGMSFATSNPVAISADGRYVTFISCGNTLVPSVANPYEIVTAYVHDMTTGQTSALAVDFQGNILETDNVGSLSGDGRFATFGTYLADRATGQFTLLNVAADGSSGNGTAFVPSISMDGSAAVFSSDSSNLAADDTNGFTDVFSFVNPFLSSPRLSSLTLGSSQAPGGTQVSASITLNDPAPTGGVTVAVWSNNEAAQPPATVVVPAGATSAQFTLTTSLVPNETVMTIVASYNGGSGVALLTLEPAPELAASPAAWDFGYQAINSTSSSESFVLTNSGTASLALNSVQLATGQVFQISADTCGSSIAAGGSCSISVIFAPSASGAASDTVQISYGSPAATFSISLTGNGATPVAALNPVPLSFGNQSMPGSSTAVATLTNSGNASLSNISASISGTDAGDFAVSSDGCSGVILPANSSCLVTVSFSPKAQGSRVASLTISDSAQGSPQSISLSGTGVQSTPTLQWNPVPASLVYGTPLGTGVLDAVASLSGNSIGGAFAYTATSNNGIPQSVTQTTVLAAGPYVLTAIFTPTDTTDYTTATATVSLTVNPSPQTITFANPRNQTVGTPLTLSATATSALAVTFTSTTTGVCTASGATATFIASGICTIDANQAGNSNYAAATTVPQSFTVNGEAQSITFPTIPVQTVGTPLILAATATSSLAVSFTSTTTGVCTVSGTTAMFIASGACTIDANQYGNSNFAQAQQAQQSFPVNGEAQTITFPTIPAQTVGMTLSLSATATSGLAVNFTSTTTGICTVSGTTATFISAGTCTIDANQAGNSIYAAATMVPQSFTVNVAPGFTLSALPTTVSVAQDGNETTTITLTDVGGFSGTVSFSTSGLPSGVTASFAAGSTAGTQVLTLTASTSAAITSTPVSVTITGTSGTLSATTTIALTITAEPSFTAGSSGATSITLSPGATTGNTGTISVVGTNGFSGTVSLACAVTTTMSGVNDMPTCSLGPTSVTLSGTTAQTSTLTVATTASSSAENQMKKLFWPSTGGTALALILLFCVPRRQRNWSAMLGLLVLLVSIGAVGCGGGSSGGGGGGGGGNAGTTPGTYSITVTGTSGSISATVGTITLTVQQ